MHYEYMTMTKNRIQIAFEMHKFMGWEHLGERNYFLLEHVAYIKRLHIMYHITITTQYGLLRNCQNITHFGPILLMNWHFWDFSTWFQCSRVCNGYMIHIMKPLDVTSMLKPKKKIQSPIWHILDSNRANQPLQCIVILETEPDAPDLSL